MTESLIPPAPASLSPLAAAAYQQRRRLALMMLAACRHPSGFDQPADWIVSLYRGYVQGRWDERETEAAIGAGQRLFTTGQRRYLPNELLDAPAYEFNPSHEGWAIQLLSAAYQAWLAAYTPPEPVYPGPLLPGQQFPPPPERRLTPAQVGSLLGQTRLLLTEHFHRQILARRPAASAPSVARLLQLGWFALGEIEQAVLESYFQREIGFNEAKVQLLQHGRAPMGLPFF